MILLWADASAARTNPIRSVSNNGKTGKPEKTRKATNSRRFLFEFLRTSKQSTKYLTDVFVGVAIQPFLPSVASGRNGIIPQWYFAKSCAPGDSGGGAERHPEARIQSGLHCGHERGCLPASKGPDAPPAVITSDSKRSFSMCRRRVRASWRLFFSASGKPNRFQPK